MDWAWVTAWVAPLLLFCFAKWACPCMELSNSMGTIWTSQGVLSIYIWAMSAEIFRWYLTRNLPALCFSEFHSAASLNMEGQLSAGLPCCYLKTTPHVSECWSFLLNYIILVKRKQFKIFLLKKKNVFFLIWQALWLRLNRARDIQSLM